MTWRKNTTQEEVEELKRFVDDMKRGLTPVTGDSLVETLRQIHDRREAESPRPDHRQLLLERLRRQMAERDGAEFEPGPGCEVVFLQPRKPRLGLRWAIAASLVAHVAFGGIILPNVRFNPLQVATVLTPADVEDDSLEVTDWVAPIALSGDSAPVAGPNENPSRAAAPGLANPTTGRPGNSNSRLDGSVTAEPLALRTPTRGPLGPPQPVAPSSISPLVESFAPREDASDERKFVDEGPSGLSGPPEVSSAPSGITDTEVVGTVTARDVDVQPRVLSKPRPTYTPDALEEEIQGAVLVSAVLGADGVVRDVRVLRGLGHGLDEAAVKAVLQMRFVPGSRGGMPVSVTQTIKVTFSLR
jgi:TonB family protein